MAENDVTIQINLESKDAQAAIELFGKESVKVLKNTEKQNESLIDSLKNSGKSVKNFFGSFEDAFLPITATIAGVVSAYSLLSNAITEAVEEAKLTRQIEASLRATDEASKDAVGGVLEFADALKEATSISDDLVKQAFITAKSFGITTDQAKELTKAAIDLAAATGVDVDTAVRQLGGTLDGSIGKVGNLGAEFRNLTADQLKAGDAIALVNEKFGGAAAKDLDTFSGRISQLTNSFKDFIKEIGKTATESSFIQSSLEATAIAVDKLTEAVKRGREEQESRDLNIGASILGTSSAYAIAAQNARLLNEEAAAFRDINIGDQSKKVADGFAGIVEQAQGTTKATSNFIDRLNSFPQSKAPDALAKTGKELEALKKEAQKLADEAKKFKEGLFGEFGTDAEKQAFRAQQALQKLAEFEKKRVISVQEAEDLRLKIVTDFNAKIEAENLRSAEKQAKDAEEAALKARQNIERAAAAPIEFAISKKGPFSKEEVAASVVGGLNMALKGKAGATELVSKTLGGIGDLLLPGIGGAVAGLAELLARGPEATKQFIKDFIKAIPDIIEAISESIPVVVETLVDVLVNRGGAARIGIAIAKAMALQPVWARIGEEVFGKSGNEIADVIKSGITEGGTRARDGFREAFFAFGPGIVKAGESFARDINESFNQAGKTLDREFSLFFENFGNTINEWVNALGTGFSQFFNNIGPAFSQALQSFAADIGEALTSIFDPFIAALRPLTDAIQSAAETIGNISNVGSGVGGFFQQIGSALGFAKGGLVYAADGFNPRGTDTVPAMLTPGEMVIPRDMVGELAAYLQRQSPENTGSDTAVLAAILSAVQAPIVVKTEAKVNQNAFADIILQLNRQNKRLTA
jgi:hypothetical protein